MKQTKEDKKKELALQAMEIFSEKGFHATSIRDLAKILNLSKGTIYDYFESKEDIITYVAKEYLFESFSESFSRFIAEAESKNLSAKDTIRFIMESVLTEDDHTPLMQEIKSMTMRKKIPAISEFYEKVMDNILPYFEQVIIRAKKEKYIPEETDPASSAVLLLTSIIGLRDLVAVFRNKFDLNKIIDTFINSTFTEKDNR